MPGARTSKLMNLLIGLRSMAGRLSALNANLKGVGAVGQKRNGQTTRATRSSVTSFSV